MGLNSPLKDGINTLNAISPYPAAGKGTLIESLKTQIPGVSHFEVGGMVRANIQQGTPLGKEVKSYSDKGLMVPDSVIVPAVRENIAKLDPNSVWLLDGFPRTGDQIGEYSELVDQLGRTDHFVYLDVPREVAEERMIRRGEDAVRNGKKPHADAQRGMKSSGYLPCGWQFYHLNFVPILK
jgi:adenylate kinase family enzyme